MSGGMGGGAGPGSGPAAGGIGAGGSGAGGAGGLGGGGLGGALGGQVLPVLIIGGLSGVVAMSALIATNVVPVHSGGSGASPHGLVLVACPGSGPVLGVVDPGQKLLVTGRSSDGEWLQVYLPGPALPYAWAPAGELQPSGDTGSLPVAACEVAAAASPTGTPIEATATPSTEPTPTPTPVAELGPKVASVAGDPSPIYYSWGTCKPDAKFSDTTRITSTITDPDGVASATLFYRAPGVTSFSNKAMTHSGSLYSASVAVPPNSQVGNLDYYIVAKDGGSPAESTTTRVRSVPVEKCDIPPTMSGFTIDPFPNGGHIYVARKVPPQPDPAAETACFDTNNYILVTGSATDPDDTVVRMVFRFTPYGDTLKSVTLTDANADSTFEGKLLPKYFKTLPNKPNGSYAFDGYFIATDKTGRSSVRYPGPNTLSLTEEACAP